MLNQATLDQLHQMKLTGFVEALREQAENPGMYHGMSFEERLGLLVDHEWASRENRRLSQRLRQARLREPACLEDLDYHLPGRKIDRHAVVQLAQGRWIANKENLLVTGKTGVGKSYLACAFANQACRSGYSTLYTRLPTLLMDMEIARGAGTYRHIMRRLGKVNLLVIDDWGLAPMGDAARRDLLEVFEERYDRGSVLIASQLDVADWHGVVGDATLADAILDRLVHNAHRIKLDGPSVRDTKKGLRNKREKE